MGSHLCCSMDTRCHWPVVRSPGDLVFGMTLDLFIVSARPRIRSHTETASTTVGKPIAKTRKGLVRSRVPGYLA